MNIFSLYKITTGIGQFKNLDCPLPIQVYYTVKIMYTQDVRSTDHYDLTCCVYIIFNTVFLSVCPNFIFQTLFESCEKMILAKYCNKIWPMIIFKSTNESDINHTNQLTLVKYIYTYKKLESLHYRYSTINTHLLLPLDFSINF